MTRYLLLWLEAPLQSWGNDSKFGRRDTLNFPTKSGVLGLVCCALGAGGEQTELLAEFASLKQTVISFVRSRNDKKIDREPLLRDFHMVGSGYNDKDPWQTLLIPKTSEGKKAVGGGTKITYRYYVQDAYFAVALEVPGDKAEALAQALQTPVWDLCLGRKSCVPTDFVFRGVVDSEADALASALKIAEEKTLLEDFRVLDGEQEGDEVLTLTDVPVCFGERKVYRDRRVTVINS
ncbi:MAG: type I-E CRISPR-associated protein Cas5/CasD [Methylobacter sp.]